MAVLAVLSVAGTACSSGAEPVVVRAQRSAAALDGGRPMRAGGRLCLEDARRDLGLRGCWEVSRLEREADPQHDYFFFTFRGGVHPPEPRQFRRVEARLEGDGAELVGWDPGGDVTIDNAGEFEGTYRRPDLTIDYRFSARPGRVHVFPDDRLFHVTWTGKAGSGFGDLEVGAVTVWTVPEGRDGFTVDASLEAELGEDG